MKKALLKIGIIATLILAIGLTCFASSGDYSTLVTQLNGGLGPDQFITVLGTLLPYIMTVTIVALVWYLIKRAIKKFSKGKPGV